MKNPIPFKFFKIFFLYSFKCCKQCRVKQYFFRIVISFMVQLFAKNIFHNIGAQFSNLIYFKAPNTHLVFWPEAEICFLFIQINHKNIIQEEVFIFKVNIFLQEAFFFKSCFFVNMNCFCIYS